MSKRRRDQQARAARGGALRRVVVGLVITVLVGLALTGWRQSRAANTVPSALATAGLTSLPELPAVAPDQRHGLDIAEANLFCAQGLNGAQDLDVGQCLATLDAWAKHVAAETARNFHQFRENPEAFRMPVVLPEPCRSRGNEAGLAKDSKDSSRRPLHSPGSEGYFRMLLLVTVLQQDFGVRYNPARMSSPEQSEPDNVFFADSQDLFLHGILGPRRMGTCAQSAAVQRR